MECPVCYENVTKDDYQALECLHSICNICFSKLHQRVCPLCRATISVSYDQQISTYMENVNEEFLDLESVILESIHNYNFGVELHTSRLNIRRRRRNRYERNQNRATAVGFRIPFVSNIYIPENINVDIEEIDLFVTESDKYKQKVRQERNRWKNQNHQTFSNKCRKFFI